MWLVGLKGDSLGVARIENKGSLCYLDGQALKRNHDCKVKKKMKFSNIVEELGDTSVGGGVCSLSNWSKDISLLAWGGEL